MPSVFITGANRGIGLEFARQYSNAGWQVVLANRTPMAPKDFASLGMDVTEFHYDAMDDATAADIAKRLKGRPIDVAILNAGIDDQPDLPPELVTAEIWERAMLTNTFAPLHLAALLEPNLRIGQHKVLAAVSSLAASSTYTVPRQFAYRASKASLNQMWRNLSVDWKDWGAICLTLRPGRVKTRMTGFEGDLTPSESVSGLRRVIETATPAESGKLWGYDGQVVPW
ncbi:SDR family NAD(P)-dependent oxidoreductase [Devosia aurantiaca]|uniref:SDR family NAD(P)-dependent oxidoreductase n=1 Tax=Devosia aurantiaca TaxID=2714858 RepID=A0A6M1SWV2_9HYPH|nr:SDR family NAD(P)-dependent oxidoreductase [Devosia aurantiaca]NGP18803.1 SDR family NAD(P)-dependent oxidoreductase [Devosia aurantiaca]